MRFAGIKHRFRPWSMVWIIIMWCMLMGEVTVANLVGGLLASLFIVFALPLPAMPVAGISVSWGKLFIFMAQWFVELMEASIKVGWLAVRPQEVPKTAIVKLPMRVENEFVLALAVSLYNLQPGGTVSDIDIANRMLTIHLLNADSEGHLERESAAVRKLEADMISIFERSHP